MRPSFLVLLVLALPFNGSAHGGGLDKNGCHTNRKTGDYHCHRGSPAPKRASIAPATRLSPSTPARASGAFANCSEARAAGAAPVRRGDPGYGPHLDRDNDGVGCEPSRGRN
ncbi:MAG: YHYH domain-containing protein [Chitinophagaceae bacterium]|nr:MAG: YHYH domain-containing protein [Chitinophagaceae bacterium]